MPTISQLPSAVPPVGSDTIFPCDVTPGSTPVTKSASLAQIVAAVGANAVSYTCPMPTGFNWDNTHFPITVSVYNPPGVGRAVGVVSVTPESLFDSFSTARSAPSATYYVSTTGNDSNSGLTSGTPFATLNKAVLTANAGGVPTMIRVAPGFYYRTSGVLGISTTVDVAWMADGGRVTVSGGDNFTAPSHDGTFTNTYSWARANVDKVLDTKQLNRYGNYGELVNVATAAICNVTPNSFASVSGTLYVNRADGAQPTTSNTIVLLSAGTVSGLPYVRTATNVFVGGINPGNGFDVQGASQNGAMDIYIASPTATQHVCVVKDSSFKYAGGIVNVAPRGVSVDSFNGLTALFNCRADANATDAFNFHNSNAANGEYFICVNCTGFDNGRNPNTSNNGWTSHDNVVGIDVAGYYDGNRGGSCRSINTAQGWLVGTYVKNDQGDIAFGGSIPPTAFQVDNTAVYWLESPKVDMPGSTNGYVVNGVGTAIHLRNAWPTGTTNSGSGTIDTPTSW